MSRDLRKQAKELAAKKYATFVFRDMTTTDEPIYVACNPELEGCCTQGETVQEARENLDLFRVDYIYHLLQNQLEVPEPLGMRTDTDKRPTLQQEPGFSPREVVGGKWRTEEVDSTTPSLAGVETDLVCSDCPQ